ncbi:hypothetical protein CBS101457_002533 [Exobasidium rhododendri]|nr:hypothetical protein CBS101457_002533 [Exobasidium rhododendri]
MKGRAREAMTPQIMQSTTADEGDQTPLASTPTTARLSSPRENRARVVHRAQVQDTDYERASDLLYIAEL